jgi:phosphonoacetaldehyde hydrolase
MFQSQFVADKWRKAHGRDPDEDDVEAMYAEVEPLLVSTVAHYADPIPGLSKALAAFQRDGIRIGSTTGYTAPMMAVLTAEARRRGYIPDSMVCPSDVPAGRPYPWMCYQNAINLQVYPMEAMVKIGDTASDIHEGLNAGMWTIGVAKTGNELGMTEAEVAALPARDLRRRLDAIDERLRKAGAHYVAESIEQCPPLIAAINARLAHGERP